MAFFLLLWRLFEWWCRSLLLLARGWHDFATLAPHLFAKTKRSHIHKCIYLHMHGFVLMSLFSPFFLVAELFFNGDVPRLFLFTALHYPVSLYQLKDPVCTT